MSGIDRRTGVMLVLLIPISVLLFTTASMRYEREYLCLVNDDQSVFGTVRRVQYWGPPIKIIEFFDANGAGQNRRFYRFGKNWNLSPGVGDLSAWKYSHWNSISFDQQAVEFGSSERRPGSRFHELGGLAIKYIQESDSFRVVRVDTNTLLAESDGLPVLFPNGFSTDPRKGVSIKIHEPQNGTVVGSVSRKSRQIPVCRNKQNRLICFSRRDNSLWLSNADAAQQLLFRPPPTWWPIVWTCVASLLAICWWCWWLLGSWTVSPFMKAAVGVFALHFIAILFLAGVNVNNSRAFSTFYVAGVLASSITIVLSIEPLSRVVARNRVLFVALAVLLLMLPVRLISTPAPIQSNGISFDTWVNEVFSSELQGSAISYEARDKDLRSDVLIGMIRQCVVLLALLFVVRRIGIRLIHQAGSRPTADRKDQISIRDLLLVTGLAAVAIAVWTLPYLAAGKTHLRENYSIAVAGCSFALLVSIMLLPRVRDLKKFLPYFALASLVVSCCFFMAMNQVRGSGAGDLLAFCLIFVCISACVMRWCGYRMTWIRIRPNDPERNQAIGDA